MEQGNNRQWFLIWQKVRQPYIMLDILEVHKIMFEWFLLKYWTWIYLDNGFSYLLIYRQFRLKEHMKWYHWDAHISSKTAEVIKRDTLLSTHFQKKYVDEETYRKQGILKSYHIQLKFIVFFFSFGLFVYQWLDVEW